MNDFFKLVLSLSLSGSVIAFILFAMRPLTKKYLSKTWQYYIWLIVILRMLIPFSPDISMVGNLFDKIESVNRDKIALTEQRQDAASVMHATEIKPYPKDQRKVHNQPEAPIAHQTKESFYDYLGNIWILWAVGALFLFSLRVFQYKRFMDHVQAGSTTTIDKNLFDLFNKVKNELGIKRKIPLYQNRILKTPMLIGLFKPVVIIPENQLTFDELNYVFRHELIHLKRLDIWYKWILQLTVCIHWFNPLMYRMNRQINRLCELSCDEAVSRGFDISKRAAYCNTILSVVSLDTAYKGNVFSMTLNEGKKDLKERLGNIMSDRVKSKRTIVLSTVIIVLLGSLAIALGAYSNSKDENGLTIGKQNVTVPNGAVEQKLAQEQAHKLIPIEGKTVLIDPGHGGEDRGAVYNEDKTSMNEKDLNLAIALLLRDMLKESGVKAELTRQGDQMTKLESRMALADDLNASLFVSIHFNNSPDRADKGTLTFYNTSGDEDGTLNGQKAALLIQEAVLNGLKTQDAGVRAMPESIKYSNLKIPALIVNVAYMTNASDREMLMDKDFNQQTAKALHDGILTVINDR
ncbi:M56 family metallopeptidase [Desulfotomaculum sp. 1211_IL3151]|uniref:M56 family metallopeptidase n=1 Tax=Desulfotomaculum sp. 1211_IL3151 TaxID=3084055 RepID=UPI002FD92F8B